MRKQVLAALGVVVGLSAVAAARPGEPPPSDGPRLERLAEELGLASAQVDELRRIGARHARQNIRRRADIQVLRIDLRELIETENSDEQAIDAKVRQLADLQAAALRAHVDRMLAMKKVLTPEQIEKWKALQLGRPPRHRPARRPLAEGESAPADEGRPDDGALTGL